MPSSEWVNSPRTKFVPQILDLLSRDPATVPCAVPASSSAVSPKSPPRRVVDVPLIVRPPSADVYTPSFRTALLNSLGVPPSSHSAKILLVSFGGQSIPPPRSRPPSPLNSPVMSSADDDGPSVDQNGLLRGDAGGRLRDGHGRRQVGLLPEGWIAIVCGLPPGKSNEIRTTCRSISMPARRTFDVRTSPRRPTSFWANSCVPSLFLRGAKLIAYTAGLRDVLQNVLPHALHLRPAPSFHRRIRAQASHGIARHSARARPLGFRSGALGVARPRGVRART